MGMIRPRQTILVHAAAGGVGTAVAQLATGKEVTLIGFTSSEEKARHAKGQGFQYLINTKEKNIVQRVHDLTAGQGADLILNSVAGDTLARDIEMLTHLGQVIWYGFTGGAPEGNLTDQLLPHLGK